MWVFLVSNWSSTQLNLLLFTAQMEFELKDVAMYSCTYTKIWLSEHIGSG